MMEICYIRKDGCAGKMSFEESVFLPVLSARDFKKILDVIAMSDKWEEHVKQLDRYINEQIEFWTGARDNSNNAKEKANFNTRLKKWIGFNAALVKAFQVEEKTDAEAKIRCKKATVYTYTKDGIIPVDGYSFQKFGRTFQVYKNEHDKVYWVIDPRYGLGCAKGDTKKEAIAAFTGEIMDRISAAYKQLESAHDRFIQSMLAAGYEHIMQADANMFEYWPEDAAPETDRPKTEEPEKKSPRPIETDVNAADHAERVPAPVRAKAEKDTLKSPTPIIKAALPGSPRLYRDRVPYKRNIRVLNSSRLLYRLIHITGSYKPYTRALYTPCTPVRFTRLMYHKRNAPHYIDTS